MSKHYIIPIFVPHFGCPHDCIFCNQKKITGLSTNVTQEEVEKTILEYLGYFKKDAFIEVAFYGGSFTAIDLETQSNLLEIPYKFKKDGLINEIRLSTRPDAIDEEVLKNLKKYEVDTIELGVQSLDEDVLAVSERGHTSDVVYYSSKLIRDYGFNLGLQMMVGLPLDSFQKSLYTCHEFIKLKPDCVRIYPTLVVKDTYLEKQYNEGYYKPLDLNKAIDQTSIFLMYFYINNINVIRVGLQPTENIQLGRDVVAGPFHAAFRQLVEANIIRLLLDFYLKDKNIMTNQHNLIIEANSNMISVIAGQKSGNIKYWKNIYGFKNVKIYQKNMDKDSISFNIDKYYDNINLIKLMDEFLKNFQIKTK
ncbi:radical SAM protein [Tissierella sp. Yu-01]|uniref:elongator complex protein 3 n=1 Tax=Tissierella sp. Yu-01 TaxID=3035694 RepID=UPI00240CECB7|nr:radical SAM protein [Tissierella sp. Yu-01]WFA09789.1 radical SAM protein [Tissierella sp. Yu-01]